MEKQELTNKIEISGTIMEKLEMDHEISGKKIYRTKIASLRRSEAEDNIEILIKDKLVKENNLSNLEPGKWIKVTGNLRTRDIVDEQGKIHLRIYVFATDIDVTSTKTDEDINLVFIDGYLCKEPLYRITPNTNKEIVDLNVAVNRRVFGKSDYIPCIAWNRIARFASGLKVGTHIKCYGRIQSRKYFKKFQDNDLNSDAEQGEWREAYELSLFRIETLE